MTSILTRTSSLLALSAFSSVTALTLCSPAIAEPSAPFGVSPFRAAQVRVAQGAPAPQVTPQLTEEEKKRIEDLKQRRLQRQGTQPQPTAPSTSPATAPATAPAAAPPPAAVKQPPPAAPVIAPIKPPAVAPRVVNPPTPPPALAKPAAPPVAQPVVPPPAGAAAKPAPVTAAPPVTKPETELPRDTGEGRNRLNRDRSPTAPAATAPVPPPAKPAPPPVQTPAATTTQTPPPVAPSVTPPATPPATPQANPQATPPRAPDDAARGLRRTNQSPPAAAVPGTSAGGTSAGGTPAGGAAPSATAGGAAAVAPTPPPAAGPAPKNLDDAKSGRTESTVKTDAGNRTVIQETDHRTIVRQGNKVVIQKDEAAQLQRVAPDAVISRDHAGTNTAVVERPNNVQIVTETDNSGQLVRRFRRDREGRETAIIDNRRKKNNFGRNLAIGVGVGAGIIAGAAILNSVVDVPAPVVRVPRDKYVVRYEDASEDDVYEALNAPPVDAIERPYTLDEVRATPRLRERMRRVDLDDINFEFGSWEVDPREYRKLERIARAMMRVIERNPNEVFLIEGYTDAVGSDVDNLTLSDRRAETVSVILSEQFQVPFENLTTQGYGEEYLKVETDAPERANRRVAVRRITPLLAQKAEVAPPPPPRRRYYNDDRRRYDDDRPYRRWRQQNRYRDGY